MAVWCSLSTIFNRRYALRIAGLLLLSIVLITTLVVVNTSHAAPATTKTINFQGRLMSPTGSVIADGHYNIQFKIYQGGAGTAASNPGGTLKWTESYVNNGSNSGVQVKNGYFSVSLGSLNSFGTSVDWSQDTLFLSMNVAGNSATCSTFGTAPCLSDGEMLPMKQITATPFALNSDAVGGKSVNELVQLGQGTQTDASNNSSIAINKTGTGNLVQLQASGTDAFTVNNAGSVTLGSTVDQSITVATSDVGEGKALAVSAGGAAVGSNQAGGDLLLQGGAGDGTGDSGNVIIAANGADTTGTFQVQNTAGEAVLNVDTKNSVVSIGSLEFTNIDGTTDQISSSGDLAISSAGEMTVGPTNSSLKLQGSSVDITASSGGNITMQGGNATVSNGNGGSVILSGGAGNGTGASGLVVLTTPTFSTTASDANCFTAGALVSASCDITAASVNNSSGIMVGFSVAGQTATLPNPTITTAGRVMYIMAANGSSDFTLSLNSGTNQITLKQNTTASLMWNGSTWTVVGGASAATLQDAYSASPQAAGGADIKLTEGTGGLSIRNSDTNGVKDSLLSVKNAGSSTLLSVNGGDSATYASDGMVNDAVNFDTNWSPVGSATTTRTTLDGQESSDSAQIAAGTAAGNGSKNKIAVNPRINTVYRLSLYAKHTSGTPLDDFTVRYSPDNGVTFVDCANYNTQTISTAEWTKITCDITTSDTAVTDPFIYFIQPTAAASARTYLVDSFVLLPATGSAANVQVGSGTGDGTDTTLFTVDKAASAPTAASPDALLGSMYYDTTLGTLQCYESGGWGACGDRPDTFITISPEYTNAVTHGDGIGNLSTDLCSDTLNINDGSSAQPTVCGANETYNFYNWTSPEVTSQSRSVFVTYQLPTSFKEFVPGTTSLMGRTNSSDASVNYQVYRNDRNASLTPCGSSVAVSTGTQSSWQKGTASGGADPSSCSFAAGDSIVIRVTLDASNDANAYISNLGFTFSNK